MGNKDIKVSVICTAYNHEKYIAQCLEGILMQKTDFSFEVFVHDDASTDKTAEIIRNYEKKYPEIIKPIYQKENQYSKGVSISGLIAPKINGDYVALCEGDDFWTDPMKLQLQYNSLQNNPPCFMCVHLVRLYKENGEPMDRTMPYPPDKNDHIIQSDEFIHSIALEYCFQTVSYFMKASHYIAYWNNTPEFKRVSRTGDYPYMLYFANLGPVYYIGTELAGHRMEGVSSWTKNYIAKNENIIPHWEREVRMFEEYDKYTNYKYHEFCEIAIDRVTYEKNIRLKDYRSVVKWKNRRFMKNAPPKMKVYIYLNALFPHAFPLLYSLARRLRDGK